MHLFYIPINRILTNSTVATRLKHRKIRNEPCFFIKKILTGRANHFACGCNGKLYIGGGGTFGGGFAEFSKTMEIYTPETSSANEISLSENMNIFPNPVADQLTIQSEDFTGIEQVQIFETSGKLVFEKAFSGETAVQLDLGHLPKGIYSAKINTDEAIESKRFLKQ